MTATTTVGDLKRALSGYDDNTPVVIYDEHCQGSHELVITPRRGARAVFILGDYIYWHWPDDAEDRS